MEKYPNQLYTKETATNQINDSWKLVFDKILLVLMKILKIRKFI